MTIPDARAAGALRAVLVLIAAVPILLGACSPAASPAPGTTGPLASPPSAAPSASPTATPSSRPSGPAPDVGLEVVATGLSTPIGLVAPPDGSGRLFVVEQTGRILILAGGAIQPDPFLDLSDRLVPLTEDYDERGLLGLAFHPDFGTNGRFFVYYSAPVRRGVDGLADHTNTLSELRVSAADPDIADASSERFVLRFEQPQPNHSGGGLGFGPDGYLYLGTGDGGGTGDASEGHSPQGNAQDRTRLNGKVLRIDVDAAESAEETYAIPGDNPFVDGGGLPEIYAYGFRNPWRLSWEPDGARRLLVSDVGYGRYEEVSVVENGGNYGWRVREGAHCLNVEEPLDDLAECDLVDDRGEPLTDPVVEYTHEGLGIAVVGGYVYRGAAIPALRGRYVFADYSREFGDRIEGRGTLLVADVAGDAGATWPWHRLVVREGPLDRFVTGMGEDANGELYVLVREAFGPVGETGEILRLVPPG